MAPIHAAPSHAVRAGAFFRLTALGTPRHGRFPEAEGWSRPKVGQKKPKVECYQL